MESPKQTSCPNVVNEGGALYSKNLVPGTAVYGERLGAIDGVEYRLWDPKRSKLAAYFLLSGKGGDFKEEDVVLYLGASTGTTVSHVSDIVDKGQVYAVEISKRTFRELIKNCAPRKNILPMLGDARDEDLMAGILTKADYLYSDVAQRDQVQIFVSNFNRYRCRSGMLMLKCRSVDVSADPSVVAKESLAAIRNRGLKCDEPLNLGDFEKDHYAIFIQRTK
jgi:fibrillarin-like pre-rRNA processing protein